MNKMTNPDLRDFAKKIVETKYFQLTIIGLIIINSAVLGLETSKSVDSKYGNVLDFFNYFTLYIFVIEVFFRIYAYGWRFFLRPWSVFDFTVVVISILPASEIFSALRTLRVLRILRLVSSISSLRRVAEGLISAIPGMLSVFSIMLVFFYIFSVIGTHLYGTTFPQWFGSLGKTMFTLFQIMTLESWSMDIVRPVMKSYPFAWLFFILFILVTTLTTLNLFIAIIVNAMHLRTDESAEESRLGMKKEIANEIHAMEKRLMAAIKNPSK